MDGQVRATLAYQEHDEAIRELKQQDEEIKKDLDGLQHGQEEINARLGKGDTRMGKIEKDLGELKEDQKNSFIEVIRLFSDLKSTIKDEQLKDVKAELRMTKDHAFTWVHGLVLTGAGGAIAIILKLLADAQQ